MQTVTFARPYRHRIDDLREAYYEPGKVEVSNEVAEAARKAGALEEDHGVGPATGKRARGNHQPEG